MWEKKGFDFKFIEVQKGRLRFLKYVDILEGHADYACLKPYEMLKLIHLQKCTTNTYKDPFKNYNGFFFFFLHKTEK